MTTKGVGVTGEDQRCEVEVTLTVVLDEHTVGRGA